MMPSNFHERRRSRGSIAARSPPMTYVTMMPRVPREVDGDASRNVITAPSSFFAMR
jgi:hypothetical protein